MTETIQAAVIGAGSIGAGTHTRSFAGAGANVVAVCDVDRSRAEAAALECGARAFSDHHAMLEAMPDIDVVSVAVPNVSHHPITMDVLAAGKHVICEKPLAMNAREAEEMVMEADRRGLVLSVHLQNRFAFRARWLSEQVQGGALGDIYHAKASILRVDSIPRGWFQVQSLAGGGALMDLGPHLLDLAWVISGRPRPLSASGYTYSRLGVNGTGFGSWGVGFEEGHGMDTEDLGGGLIRCEGGVTLEIEASWAVHLEEPTLQCTFFGDRGGARLFPNARVYARGETLSCTDQPSGDDITPFEDFIGCVRSGSRPVASGRDGLMIVKMLDALYASARTGREAMI